MIRIRGGVVFGGVARVAVGGCAGEFAAHMARHALRGRVFADQGEADSGVVEGGAQPVGGRVACRAILRIAEGLVIGIRGGVVLVRVARVAGRAQGRVLAARVALRASRGGVFAGERELGLAVIEGRAQPVGGRVAERTILREAGRDVIGIGGALVVLQVARIASGAQALVNAARMALQCKSRSCACRSAGTWFA